MSYQRVEPFETEQAPRRITSGNSKRTTTALILTVIIAACLTAYTVSNQIAVVNEQRSHQAITVPVAQQQQGVDTTRTIAHHNITGIYKDSLYIYKGIEYATQRRFHESVVNSPFNPYLVGPLNASAFGPACAQPYLPFVKIPYHEMSEDCLYLNVYTTVTPKDSLDNTKRQPVMVWVHGGGFKFGAGSKYDASNLAKRNVTLVTLNYRLGPLGFYMPLPRTGLCKRDGTYCGMNGVNDVVNALIWVQRYIANFGGDKTKVTIFGESAGAVMVCALIFSPYVRNLHLFDKVAIESGPCNGAWGPAPTPIGWALSGLYWKDFVKHQQANYSIPPNVKTYDECFKRYNDTKSCWELELDLANWKDIVGIPQKLWVPSVDGHILSHPVHYYLKQSSPQWNGNHFLIGGNSRDGLTGLGYLLTRHFYPKRPVRYVANETVFEDAVKCSLLSFAPLNNEKRKIWIREYEAEFVSTITQMYSTTNNPDDGSAWTDSLHALNSDMCINCPSRNFAQLADRANKNVWIYEYFGANPPYQAYHGSEISNVFGIPAKKLESEVPGAAFNATLSDKMQTAWTNFAKFGNPNSNQPNDKVNWSRYDQSSNFNGDEIRGIRFIPQSDWRTKNFHKNCSFIDRAFDVGSDGLGPGSRTELNRVVFGKTSDGVGYFIPVEWIGCLDPFGSYLLSAGDVVYYDKICKAVNKSTFGHPSFGSSISQAFLEGETVVGTIEEANLALFGSAMSTTTASPNTTRSGGIGMHVMNMNNHVVVLMMILAHFGVVCGSFA